MTSAVEASLEHPAWPRVRAARERGAPLVRLPPRRHPGGRLRQPPRSDACGAARADRALPRGTGGRRGRARARRARPPLLARRRRRAEARLPHPCRCRGAGPLRERGGDHVLPPRAAAARGRRAGAMSSSSSARHSSSAAAGRSRRRPTSRGLALAEELGARATHAWFETSLGELARKQGQYDEARELARPRRSRVRGGRRPRRRRPGAPLRGHARRAARRLPAGALELRDEPRAAPARSDDRANMASILSNLGDRRRVRGRTTTTPAGSTRRRSPCGRTSTTAGRWRSR